ncbi:hypothetical protein BY996DRAFT_6412719 [Phakopsora pachyrhizi]|nr:hypothetical protein BY996DRAFT_6412719 [Phakopsora pachyrhizi]
MASYGGMYDTSYTRHGGSEDWLTDSAYPGERSNLFRHSQFESDIDGNVPYERSIADPGNPHLGVSDEDWNEARQELATLGLPGSSQLHSFHGGHDHYSASSAGRLSPGRFAHADDLMGSYGHGYDCDDSRLGEDPYADRSYSPRDHDILSSNDDHGYALNDLRSSEDYIYPQTDHFSSVRDHTLPYSDWESRQDNFKPFGESTDVYPKDEYLEHSLNQFRSKSPGALSSSTLYQRLDEPDRHSNSTQYFEGLGLGDHAYSRSSGESGWDNSLPTSPHYSNLHVDSRRLSELYSNSAYHPNNSSLLGDVRVEYKPYSSRDRFPEPSGRDSFVGEYDSGGQSNLTRLDQLKSPLPGLHERRRSLDGDNGSTFSDSFPHYGLENSRRWSASEGLSNIRSEVDNALRHSLAESANYDKLALARISAHSPGALGQRNLIDSARDRIEDSLASSASNVLNDSKLLNSHGISRSSTPLSSAVYPRSPYQPSFIDPYQDSEVKLRGSLSSSRPITPLSAGLLARSPYQQSLTASRMSTHPPTQSYGNSFDQANLNSLSRWDGLDRKIENIERLNQNIRMSEQANQTELALMNQKSLDLYNHSILQSRDDIESHRERLEIERERSELNREQLEAQIQMDNLSLQTRAIARQQDIDQNRRMANLSRLGSLSSTVDRSILSRPLSAPYQQQSRLLSAARSLSERDSNKYRLPTYDHVDSYYSMLSNHLPNHLPMFRDPYWRGSNSGSLRSSAGLNLLAPRSSLGSSISRMRDPFQYGIDYDYGYGRVGRLGLSHNQFAREHALALDDLYLFELLLRLDRQINDTERQRRWSERLRWEEWADNKARIESWKRMSEIERRRLGLGEGSYWASSLFRIPLSSQFGYSTALDLRRSWPSSSMISRSHFSLTPRLSARYPMWSRGGLGLGRRISRWYDFYPPLTLKQLQRQEAIRRDYAERRGEIPPRPKAFGVGLMGTGVPGRPALGVLRDTPGFLNRTSSLGSSRPLGSRSNLSLIPEKSLDFGPSSRLYPHTSGSYSTRTPLKPISSLSNTLYNARPLSVPFNARASSPDTSAKERSFSDIRNLSQSKSVFSSFPSKTSIPLSSSASGKPDLDGRPNLPHSSSTNQNYSRKTTSNSNCEVISVPPSRPYTPSGGVAFNPTVKSISLDNDAPPEPRPPSRLSKRPSRSALKTPPIKSNGLNPSTSLNAADEQRLEFITKTNTVKNRSTPALPEQLPKSPSVRKSN